MSTRWKTKIEDRINVLINVDLKYCKFYVMIVILDANGLQYLNADFGVVFLVI